MALTLVGVTPGAFKAWSDCNSVSSSSIAAMLILSVSEETDDEKRNLRRVCADDSSVVSAPNGRTLRLYSKPLVKIRGGAV